MPIGFVLLFAIGYGIYRYSKSPDSSMDIARRRFANGEISKTESDEIIEILTREVEK